MTPDKVSLACRSRRATNQRGRYCVCKIVGLLCMVLVFATTVRASNSQIRTQNEWSEEGGVIRSQEKDSQGSQLNRVAIIGKPINKNNGKPHSSLRFLH
jgi:hypothetical protein